MTEALVAAIAAIDRAEPAMLVEVSDALGSTPREAGALMLVTETTIAGTIGGGELEWRAIERAREALAGEPVPERLQLPLGPALQQCCGGHVTLSLRRLAPDDRHELNQRLQTWHAALPRIVLFGAGHVGQALVRALTPLPCRIRWHDSRQGLFPDDLDPTIEALIVTVPAVMATDPTDIVLVMTHSHTLDLAIVEARLRAMDFAWLGLIGSATKRRRFERQLRAGGVPPERLERLICPIGLAAIRGKEPEVIAASVTAQLLTVIEALRKDRALPNVA
jgi:xanthine dehydrogenase accessory factor/xanthine dehydrogenase large subunit